MLNVTKIQDVWIVSKWIWSRVPADCLNAERDVYHFVKNNLAYPFHKIILCRFYILIFI